jgi:DNA-directed RNA polymerase specialized sigma24 family protein
MTEAELEEALQKLLEHRSKLTDDQVEILRSVWPILVRSQLEAVKRLVGRRVPEHAVPDVEAEVFESLYGALLDGFPPSLLALTYTIAARRVADWWRDHEDDAATQDLPSSGSLKPPSSAPGVEDLAALRELWVLGEELRALLSPEHQDVWDLVLVGEASLTAAAEALGLPEGTLKSRALATRRAVKEAWKALMISKGRPG